ncbi:uncharacterized protein HaLaN_21082 [Haematococcus lacustris]|uniref:Uncharacterized protein n=1 Tax=Haematococcus lacustris TaxID=44745 RepID=A0A699ZL17_HAELA|nr:uncharacterized protein HaLaN_21082 [Haematococcus lacustris]
MKEQQGATRGWLALDQAPSPIPDSYLARVLTNKRVRLALMAPAYPWLDIGITLWNEPVHPLTGTAVDQAVKDSAYTTVTKGKVDVEAWGKYLASLSIDGHGPPWRLAQQLLGGAPVLKVESPFKAYQYGATRGWLALDQAPSPIPDSYLARVLTNKRVRLALMAPAYPWLDIGITLWNEPVHPLTGTAVDQAVRDSAYTTVTKGKVDVEAWGKYLASLSIDGHGPPWRLAQQLLGGAPVLKVESPFKECLHDLLHLTLSHLTSAHLPLWHQPCYPSLDLPD